MKVTLHYFAQVREMMGKESETITLRENETVGGLMERLFLDAAWRDQALRYWRVAVNQEYGSLTTQLSNGDEVVFIPPVAGG